MKRLSSRPLLGALTALGLVSGLLGPATAQPTAAVELTDDPVAMGEALAGDTSWVTGAEFETRAGATTTALVSGGVAGMPTNGPRAAMLSTGDARTITTPNTASNTGRALWGGSVRGNSDFDVTILRVDLQVPETVNCLVGMDFRFLSEEYPEFVGSPFNDAFIAELDESTWTTSGSQIIAPDNFAYDPTGSPITINSAGTTSIDDTEAAGTTFDGATPMLTAATPLTPGKHSLYLSIFDQGDWSYDSAVIIDNLRMGTVGDVATECTPGAEVVEDTQYVALGDSYSSGFGVQPYQPGTHDEVKEEDGGGNNCQRSELAYSSVLAAARELELDFHACQGAVTQDFYQPRNTTWGEVAQLDHLDERTDLVSFSIGGNDAKFGEVLAQCIDGVELLPFNTCYQDDKVLTPVREAMQRLDGQAGAPADITPYSTLFGDVREAAPTATAVAVGYPYFYPETGGDRISLPGARCEGVKKADQRWMVEKIDELNAVIESHARRHGFLFANPNPRFAGHELCGGGEEWIYPLLDPGRIHPTAQGQQAISEAVAERLEDTGFESFTVRPQETVTYSFAVGSEKEFISLVTGWPGSDVSLSLVSPSGQRYDRATQAPDTTRKIGPTYEHLEVTDPELGQWTVELFGLDVPAGGEPVSLSLYQAEPANQAPTGVITARVEGDSLVLDAAASTDTDGQIAGADWYITTAETDEVLSGQTITLPLDGVKERTITLVVTDDRGATDFRDLAWVPIDVLPGSNVNPVKLGSKGLTPIALLSSDTFEATTVTPSTLRIGPGKATAQETTARPEDVNGDGRQDQIIHVRTQDLGLAAGDTQLCLTGALDNERPISSCDTIRVK